MQKVMKGQLRWSIIQASGEFQVGTKKLTTALRNKAIEPGADGTFSTAHIVEALFDSERKERLRSLKEQADHRALQMQNFVRTSLTLRSWAAGWPRPYSRCAKSC